MLICMRTTILLPDDLYAQVRLTAARERRTVTSVIEESLRESLRRREQADGHPVYRVDVITEGAVAVGVDLDDSAALLELMEDT